MSILLSIALAAALLWGLRQMKMAGYWRAEAVLARSEAENLRLGAAVKFVSESPAKIGKTETKPLELCEGATVSWAIEGGKTVAKIEA